MEIPLVLPFLSADSDTLLWNPDNVHIIFIFSNSFWDFAYVHFENTSRSQGRGGSVLLLHPDPSDLGTLGDWEVIPHKAGLYR